MVLPRPATAPWMDTATRRLRILLVEDDAVLSTVLAELLAALGHDVCGIATTEVEAIAAALRTIPDVMLVDANLQAGSGMSAMSAILRQTVIPHIYMTGRSRLAVPANATVLQKPFDMAGLKRALDHVAGQMARQGPEGAQLPP